MSDRRPQPPVADWVIRTAQPGSVERIEAWFGSHGYDPHRHDTYSIGRTLLAGVQSFHYKGSLRHGLPGNTLVLHPDEMHDGMAGTEAGFRYRMAYIDPALIQNVLGGEPLPFIGAGLSEDPRLYRASETFVQALDHPLDTLEEQDALYDLAMAMRAVAGKPRGRKRLDFVSAERARAQLGERLHSSSNTCIRASPWTCSNRPAGASAGACRGTFARSTAPAPTASSPCADWTTSGA